MRIDDRSITDVYGPEQIKARPDGAKALVAGIQVDRQLLDNDREQLIDYLVEEWRVVAEENGTVVGDPTVHVEVTLPSGRYSPTMIAVGWVIPAELSPS